MPNTKASQPGAVKHFWDRYIQHLANNGVKSAVTRWYVIRAEQYIKAFPDKRLVSHCSKDVVDCLEV